MTILERHVYKPDPEDPSECSACGRSRDVHPDEQLPLPPRRGRKMPTAQAARRAGEQGAEAAHAAADDAWKELAARHLRQVAAESYRTGAPFCSNDVWASGLPDPPGDRRALAGVIGRARTSGLIVHAGKGATSLLGHGSDGNAWWLGTAKAAEPEPTW